MAKNTNRVASAFAYVAALGLATGVAANHWELSTKNMVTYASEIFGEGAADIELTLTADDPATPPNQGDPAVDESTRVELELFKPGDGTQNIGADSEITVTFTLHGAKFGNTIQINDFKTSPDDLEVVNGSKKDGRVGDSSVTVGFKAMDAFDAGMDASVRPTVSFAISAIEDAAGLAVPKSAVRVAAEVELVGTSGGNRQDFAIEVCPPGVPAVVAVVADPNANPPVAAVAPVAAIEACTETAPFPMAMNVIAQSARALTFGKMDGDMDVGITLADRTKLKAAAVNLGSLTFAKVAAQQANGTDAFTLESGGKGNIGITVTGDIRDGDSVYFDQDGDKKMGAKESLTITDGVASGSFRLSNAMFPAAARYTPDGETELKAGDFSTTFAVVYDTTSTNDPAAVKAAASLAYDGVSQEARAYAIPNPGMNDIGNVRIRCEAGSSAMCTVFLDCNAQDGTPYFGELGSTIPGGTTTVLQAQAIADAVGAENGWEGRLSCDVLSSADVSVQVLVRSGDSLINNTYIDGGN